MRLTRRGWLVVAALPAVLVLVVALLARPDGPPRGVGGLVAKQPLDVVEVGSAEATWYGPGMYGGLTASGDRFDPDRLAAAHPSLPLGTRVRLTGPFGDRVSVTVNDRLPAQLDDRIDLTEAAFAALADLELGRIEVRMEIFVPAGQQLDLELPPGTPASPAPLTS